ncbi:hypothetical protein L7F22_024615 [Adiantum nelumboides]|nr:hypothetical protein [Adiantum nelumboides]
MVLTSASVFSVIPLADTEPLSSAPQVSISKPSFPFKVKAFDRRKPTAPGVETSVFCQTSGSLVARARLLIQSSSEIIEESNLSRKVQFHKVSGKGLKGLQSNGLRSGQSHGDEGLQDNPRQALQRLKGLSALRTDIKSNKPVRNLENRKGRHHLFLDLPAHNRLPGGLESALVERNHSGMSNALTGKSALPPKRRGSRNSSRGFDVLDDLILSQSRSSRAVLESLQSEVAIQTGEVSNHGREVVDEIQKSPFLSRKLPARNDMARNLGGISPMIADSGRVGRWQPTYEDKIGSASGPSPFASSIEKALSPSAKSFGSTNTNASNASVLQPSVLSSQPEDILNVPQPGLRGQEVLWALQKAAIEKAKQKQKIRRKPNDRTVRDKEKTVTPEASDWRNAKPIVLKSEWDEQMDSIERRMETLKNSISSA